MKMKAIFKFLAVALASLTAFSSCAGFLDENPTTSLSESTVYTTEEALDAQLYGCYQGLHNSALWKGYMTEFLHISSGLVSWKNQRTTDDWLDALTLGKYSTSRYGNSDIWKAVYAGINRCNRLLDNLPASPVNDGYKTEIEAETKFLRALLYYAAVRIWGDVPVFTTSPTSVEEVNTPRMAWYKVYAQVISDLEFAEKNMRSDYAAIQAEELSRPCNWAATAVKSSVYLTIGSLLAHPDDNFWDSSKDAALIAEGKDPRSPDFSSIGIRSAADAFKKAYDTAVDVIDNGPYSLIRYKNLFRWTEHEDWFNSEAIFVLTSSNTSGTNYNSTRMLPPFPAGTANFKTVNSNYGRIRPSRFNIENILKHSNGTLGTGSDNSEVYAATEDPRFGATFITYYIRQDNNKPLNTYPKPGYVNTRSGDYATPYCRKYLDPTYDVTNGKADFYYMRLAEVYLIAAEAAASLSSAIGDSYFELSLKYLNRIRQRARGIVNDGDIASSDAPSDYYASDFTSLEDLLDAIFWERQCELSFEGHEFFDTHRYGSTWLKEKIAEPHNLFMSYDFNQLLFEYTYNNTYYPTDKDELRKSLLVPVPEIEVRLNQAITGNNDFYWQ